MDNHRTVVLAPHDDGEGAFAVLCRQARALVHVADENNYHLHLYFLNSSAVDGGQKRLDDVVRKSKGVRNEHTALFVPTDNLIWLPKNPQTAAVDVAQIPDMLRKWARPLWQYWPCRPNWIGPDLPSAHRHPVTGIKTRGREYWIMPDNHDETSPFEPWRAGPLIRWKELPHMTPEWWRDVALGISMGVPQLHRIARREGFPSIEIGDWFFSVGLRGCMIDSSLPPDVIATAEPDLKMIEEDEFKATEVWITLLQAPRKPYKGHLERSPVRFREMKAALWSGDPLPEEGIEKWAVAESLLGEIRSHLETIRKVDKDTAARIRVAHIVAGKTGVWNGVFEKLRNTEKTLDEPAIIEVDRAKGVIMFLERAGNDPKLKSFKSNALTSVASEERYLATCRASDFGVTRTAGGVLSFAQTRRPAVLVDEPGHWLGRIQQEQCLRAGLCIAISVDDFVKDPANVVQEQARNLDLADSDLSKTAETAKMLPVGAERDLAEYLFKMYLERTPLPEAFLPEILAAE